MSPRADDDDDVLDAAIGRYTATPPSQRILPAEGRHTRDVRAPVLVRLDRRDSAEAPAVAQPCAAVCSAAGTGAGPRLASAGIGAGGNNWRAETRRDLMCEISISQTF